MRRLTDGDLSALLATLPQGLALVETSGAILFANPRAHGALWLGAAGAAASRAVQAGLAGLLEGAAGSSDIPAHRAQLTLARERTLRALVLFVAAERAAVLLRPEEIRTADIERALAGLGLGPGYARLAARVYRGWTNRAIAEACGIPTGRVKWRLAQVFQRLGVKRRAALTWAVDRLLGQLDPAAHASTAIGRRGDVNEENVLGSGAVAPAVLRDLRRFLQHVDLGFAAVDDAGALVWANAAAERLLGADAPHGGRRPRAALPLMRMAARVAAGEPPPPRTLSLDGGGGRLGATLWQVRSGLAGLRLHREQLRARDALATLGDDYGLSPPQARAALLLGRGGTLADVARALQVPEGTVRAMSGTIYTKLGVHSRTELAALLRDLGAGPAAGGGGGEQAG